MNQCWNIVIRTAGKKIQWNINRHSYISIQENASDNIVCKMATILSRGIWVTFVGVYSFINIFKFYRCFCTWINDDVTQLKSLQHRAGKLESQFSKRHLKIPSDKLRPFYAGSKVIPDSKVPGANMGPTWVLSASDGSHAGPMNLAIRDVNWGIQFGPKMVMIGKMQSAIVCVHVTKPLHCPGICN